METSVNDYLTKIKKDDIIYKKILVNILKKDIVYELLIGENDFSYSYKKTESREQIPSMVFFVLHILVQERDVFNDKINEAFNKIPINNKYVCLLLDYYYTYLIYFKKMDNLLEIDFTTIIHQIKENISEFENQYCVRYFTQKINEESGEQIFPDISI